MPYASLARHDQLAWPTIEEVLAAARSFLDPVLQQQAIRSWDPSTWSWR
jgi:hypothetical protein